MPTRPERSDTPHGEDCPVCENRRELKQLGEGMEPYKPSAATTVRGCAHPQRCGSDGIDCCHQDCSWSPEAQLRREEELLLRTMRVAQMQREQDRAVLRRRIFDEYR